MSLMNKIIAASVEYGYKSCEKGVSLEETKIIIFKEMRKHRKNLFRIRR